MFTGHYAAAFAAKRVAPSTSLGVLIAAAQLPDLIWPIFLMLGVEHAEIDPGNTALTPLAFTNYPWTHSLLFTALWGAVLAGLLVLMRRDRRGALVAGALVVSHWVLDVVVHRPDLPLVPGGPLVGLGLWNHVGAALVVEWTLFAAGVWLYGRTTQARNAVGRYAWVALVAVLALIHIANTISPPPPSISAVAAAGLLLWLFVPWGWWIDRNRQVAASVAASGSMSREDAR